MTTEGEYVGLFRSAYNCLDRHFDDEEVYPWENIRDNLRKAYFFLPGKLMAKYVGPYLKLRGEIEGLLGEKG